MPRYGITILTILAVNAGGLVLRLGTTLTTNLTDLLMTAFNVMKITAEMFLKLLREEQGETQDFLRHFADRAMKLCRFFMFMSDLQYKNFIENESSIRQEFSLSGVTTNSATPFSKELVNVNPVLT